MSWGCCFVVLIWMTLSWHLASQQGAACERLEECSMKFSSSGWWSVILQDAILTRDGPGHKVCVWIQYSLNFRDASFSCESKYFWQCGALAESRIGVISNFFFLFLKSLNPNVFPFASSLYAFMLKTEVLLLAKIASFYKVVSVRSFFLLFCFVRRKKLILWWHIICPH